MPVEPEEGPDEAVDEIHDNPRVVRELRRLANDGDAPDIFEHRTRSHVAMTTLQQTLMNIREPGIVNPQDYNPVLGDLESTVMTQMTIKKGLRAFGEAGEDAVLKELQQLHDRSVMLAVLF
jgi:hypothetical protein